jgi:two-component system phosphate regulon sensor histidine kinase PhoR
VVGPDGRIVLMNPALKAMLLVAGQPEGKNVLHVIRNADLSQLLSRAREEAACEGELELSGLMPRRPIRREFVANASHELRSPLTSIRAAAETLESAYDDPESAKRFAGLIVRNAERLQSLVDDMMELSRAESREVRLVLEAVDLNSLVERVVAQFLPRAESRRMQLTYQRDMPAVRADRRALEQALGNLIDNALKYCPEGASIHVGANREDGFVRLAVADDGPGIAPPHQERVFERFYRVDAGRSRELGGTGLGLAIVKHLVEAMGGSVGVESRAGAGSTFYFTLHAGA